MTSHREEEERTEIPENGAESNGISLALWDRRNLKSGLHRVMKWKHCSLEQIDWAMRRRVGFMALLTLLDGSKNIAAR